MHWCIFPRQSLYYCFCKAHAVFGGGVLCAVKKKFLYALNCIYSFVLFFPATADEERVLKTLRMSFLPLEVSLKTQCFVMSLKYIFVFTAKQNTHG